MSALLVPGSTSLPAGTPDEGAYAYAPVATMLDTFGQIYSSKTAQFRHV